MSDELKQEIEALKAHNSELLADLRKAKAKATELAGQVEALTTERDEAVARAKAVTLDKPVADMLARVSLAPDLFAHAFGREFDFALDGDGIVILDKEGNPATVPDDKGKPRPAQFTEADIRKLAESSPHKETFAPITIASRASGGGALGSRIGPPASDTPKGAGQQPAPVFGFR